MTPFKYTLCLMVALCVCGALSPAGQASAGPRKAVPLSVAAHHWLAGMIALDNDDDSPECGDSDGDGECDTQNNQE